MLPTVQTRHSLSTNIVSVIALAMLVIAGVRPADAQTFVPLGSFEPEPGTDWHPSNRTSTVRGLSADGQVVVGASNHIFAVDGGTGISRQSFRWTPQEGLVRLGLVPGTTDYADGSIATGVSADGKTIVGAAGQGNSQPFLWTEGSGWGSGLGTLPGHVHAFPTGLSGDGRIVAGFSQPAGGTGAREAFRWTPESGMEGLGFLTDDSDRSFAEAISTDGNHIVGSSVSPQGWEAFAWNSDDGMWGLGDLPGGNFASGARGVSADGQFIVGGSSATNGMEAYRWSILDGMLPLGDLAGGTYSSEAIGVSINGDLVVGRSRSDNGWEAFLWSPDNGMQSIQELLIGTGLDLSGWQLTEARGISADGLVIVGNGLNPLGYEEGWLVDFRPVPEPSTIALFAMAFFALAARYQRTRRARGQT